MLKYFFLVLCWAFLTVSSAVRAQNPVGQASGLTPPVQIEKIVLTVSVSLDEAARDIIVDKLTSMTKRPFVYLDLTLVFSTSAQASRPYSVSKNGKPGNKAVDCGYGGLLMGRGVTYHLAPIANYNHLLISVTTGDRSSFPYHDISCEYRANTDQTGFRVRGFFHVIDNAIPTAVSLQLRPFTPPFALASKVLLSR